MTRGFFSIAGHDCVRMKASTLMVGDTVCFATGRHVYVEELDTSPIGQVRVTHGDGSASSCFGPDEYVYIAHPRTHKRS